ncbi:MAG: hypothetical protein ACKO4K_09765, partial [Flavobacteriales bacterium]
MQSFQERAKLGMEKLSKQSPSILVKARAQRLKDQGTSKHKKSIHSLILGIITLVFLALGFSNGLAQGTVEHKYSVALRTYTPIYLTGSNKYYNDDWILTENSNYKRAYFKYAFGFDFSYFLSDNVSLNFWNGLSRRTLHEESYSESYNLFGQLMTNSASFDY